MSSDEQPHTAGSEAAKSKLPMSRRRARVSKQAAARKTRREFTSSLDNLHMALADARAAFAETAGDDLLMQRELMKLLQKYAFEAVCALVEEGSLDDAALSRFHAIAKTMCTFGKSFIETARWSAEQRALVRTRISSATEQIDRARALGLSHTAAEEIRDALLEITSGGASEPAYLPPPPVAQPDEPQTPRAAGQERTQDDTAQEKTAQEVPKESTDD